jgi:hypothetical protein
MLAAHLSRRLGRLLTPHSLRSARIPPVSLKPVSLRHNRLCSLRHYHYRLSRLAVRSEDSDPPCTSPTKRGGGTLPGRCGLRVVSRECACIPSRSGQQVAPANWAAPCCPLLGTHQCCISKFIVNTNGAGVGAGQGGSAAELRAAARLDFRPSAPGLRSRRWAEAPGDPATWTRNDILSNPFINLESPCELPLRFFISHRLGSLGDPVRRAC